MRIQSLAAVAGLYLLVSLIGLHVGLYLIDAGVPPIVGDPESVGSSLIIFAYILVATAVMLVLLKYGLDRIIKVMILLALFMGLTISLESFIGGYAFLLAIGLLVLFHFWRDVNLMNLILLVTIPGIAAWLGNSLGLKPALILLVILAVYDVVAVFGTKHMVTLAEKAKGKLPFMFLIPFTEERTLGLGTGDFAIPVAVVVSVMNSSGLPAALYATAGGLLGLTALMMHISRKEGAVLPALPPITAGLLLGYGVSLVL